MHQHASFVPLTLYILLYEHSNEKSKETPGKKKGKKSPQLSQAQLISYSLDRCQIKIFQLNKI